MPDMWLARDRDARARLYPRSGRRVTPVLQSWEELAAQFATRRTRRLHDQLARRAARSAWWLRLRHHRGKP
jgi:hypothetical protein